MAENGLQIFENVEFGKVRGIEIEGESWLVGKDVAQVLGYQNPSKAIADHVDEEDKLNNESLSSLGQRGGWLINESGLYSLVISSKLKDAKKFKRWVTHEVIPSIRKHGGYLVGQDQMSPEELLSRAVLFANSKIKELETQIKAERPKVEFANKVIADDNLIDINTFAKLIEEKKILSNGKLAFIGRNGLFALLGGMNILQKKNRNLPLQKYINQGYFVVKYPQGHDSKTYPKTYITGKGQVWLTKKLKEYCELHNVG